MQQHAVPHCISLNAALAPPPTYSPALLAPHQIKPGRFMSWPNRGNKHCVVTNSPEPRRFLGPLVLDKGASSFIPVVDILAGPAQACTTNGDCTTPGETCDGKLCCTAAGGAATYDTFCCPGSIFWNPQRKCCYMTGMSASSAEQCCYGRLIDSVCAPPGSVRLWQGGLRGFGDYVHAIDAGARQGASPCRHASPLAIPCAAAVCEPVQGRRGRRVREGQREVCAAGRLEGPVVHLGGGCHAQHARRILLRGRPAHQVLSLIDGGGEEGGGVARLENVSVTLEHIFAPKAVMATTLFFLACMLLV